MISQMRIYLAVPPSLIMMVSTLARLKSVICDWRSSNFSFQCSISAMAAAIVDGLDIGLDTCGHLLTI
jgi:hypothetical protein